MKEGEVGGPRGTCGEGKKYMQGFGIETGREEPLGRLWHRWVCNIKMGLTVIGQKGMEWLDLSRDRHRYQDGNKSLGSIRCGKVDPTGSRHKAKCTAALVHVISESIQVRYPCDSTSNSDLKIQKNIIALWP
jgi:hypothetical protein